MTKQAFDTPKKQSGRAAVKKTYSPQELAEMYKTSRADFVGIDLEEVTLNWNPNYIYSFFKEIGDSSMINDIIEWMIVFWEEKNGLYASYDNTLDLAESHAKFKQTLHLISNNVSEWLEKKAHRAQLKEKMLHGYTPNTMTADPKQAVASEKTETAKPQFTSPTLNTPVSDEVPCQVLLEDLPADIRNKVVVTQKVFDVYVKQLNEDLWLTVKKDKTKLCGCLYFLSNYFMITSRNTSVVEYDKLLHCVIIELKEEGSLVPSIRRREETTQKRIDRSYLCYSCADVNKNMEQEIFKLRNDCKVLLDGFQPMLDAKKEEEKNKADDQAVQASLAV